MKIPVATHNKFSPLINIGSLILTAGLILFASPGENNGSALAWIALIPFLFVITRQGISPCKAAIYGLFCGILTYCALLYWIMIVLGKYGEMPAWITVPVLLLLALYMALYTALFAYLTNRLQKRFSLIWIAPVLWVALDWLRSVAFTGFPWMDLAYTQFRNPHLLQIADLCGHDGLTFMIVLVNSLLLTAGRSLPLGERNIRSLASPLLAVLLIISCLVYSSIRFNTVEKLLETAPRMNIAVVQGDIDQGQKWLPSTQRRTLNKYLKMSHNITEEEHPELVVWPETAMPFYLLESRYLSRIKALTLADPHPSVLTGAPSRELNPVTGKPSYFNSAFLVGNGDGPVLRYDKQHLVPFGEYVPLKKFLPFLAPFVEAVADFTPGRSLDPLPCHQGKVGVLICFESIFPALARARTAAGANLLVNLTNDAWYGKSSAPWQHLSMVVLRAVENRRSVARSANTGISCFVDPLGRMSKISPLFADFAASESVPLITERSFFTFGGGGYFGMFCMFVLLILSIIAFKNTSVNDMKGDRNVN